MIEEKTSGLYEKTGYKRSLPLEKEEWYRKLFIAFDFGLMRQRFLLSSIQNVSKISKTNNGKIEEGISKPLAHLCRGKVYSYCPAIIVIDNYTGFPRSSWSAKANKENA